MELKIDLFPHVWDVSTAEVESTSGKLSWLNYTWKGIYLYKFPQLTSGQRLNTKHEIKWIVSRL